MLQASRSRILAALVALSVLVPACGSDPGPTVVSSPSPRMTVTPTAPVPVSTTPAPVPTPSSADRFSADRLARAIRAADLERHLAAFQEIADRHGGDRATGTGGHEASVAYVTGVLEAAGYAVERHAFTLDGVAGMNVLVGRAAGGTRELVMLGAHLDSAAASPGINDNGSGAAAVLAIAEALAGLPAPDRTIRLAFWDAEEDGSYGSRAHVEALAREELGRIGAYLNLDMIGSPNAIRLVYAEADAAGGSDRITELFAAHFEDSGLPWEPVDLEGDSDHGPFIAAGIPTGGLFSGGIEPVTDAQAARFGATPGLSADACSHRPCDTLDNVNLPTLVDMARAAAHVLATLAAAEDP